MSRRGGEDTKGETALFRKRGAPCKKQEGRERTEAASEGREGKGKVAVPVL